MNVRSPSTALQRRPKPSIYSGGRAELRALLRLTASRFIDMRDPIQIAYARIATRAMSMAA
jgi:hypothetical protein